MLGTIRNFLNKNNKRVTPSSTVADETEGNEVSMETVHKRRDARYKLALNVFNSYVDPSSIFKVMPDSSFPPLGLVGVAIKSGQIYNQLDVVTGRLLFSVSDRIFKIDTSAAAVVSLVEMSSILARSLTKTEVSLTISTESVNLTEGDTVTKVQAKCSVSSNELELALLFNDLDGAGGFFLEWAGEEKLEIRLPVDERTTFNLGAMETVRSASEMDLDDAERLQDKVDNFLRHYEPYQSALEHHKLEGKIQ